MSTTMLYTICVLGAVGLYLLVRPSRGRTNRERGLTAAGVLLGLGAFAGLLVAAAERVGPPETRPELFFTIFSLIALAAAVRMITHSRPVYSALYFVLVVLASAGLFLLLQAEFMAFALIIVYAGAILITYMFVLMLAQQAPTADDDRGQPEYDLNPREPAAGVIVGFIVLALLSRMALDGTAALDPPPTPVEARQAAWSELEQLPGRVLEHAGSDMRLDAGLPAVEVEPAADGLTAVVRGGGLAEPVTLDTDALPENVQSVGLALVSRFPVSLELAGVILLMAMFGAVILARRQIELTEDETREAAGMRRLGHHDDPAPAGGGPDA